MTEPVWTTHERLTDESDEDYNTRMKKRYYEFQEYFQAYQRRYNAAHKERLTAPVVCECGSTYQYQSASKHRKTKKHCDHVAAAAAAIIPI